MTEDLFKNPFKTELYEFDGGEEPPPVPVGFFGMGHIRRNANGPVRIVGTTSPKFHKPRISVPSHIKTLEQADQWAAENGIQGRARHRVTVRDISTNHRGGGPLEEVRMRDRRGKLVDTERGGYVDPKTNEIVPHAPLPPGWKRLDSGIKPRTSPVDKSQWPKAADYYGPINKAAHEAKMEEARKKAEAKELKRLADEQLLIRRQQLIDKRQSELDSPSQPKPRGRPPKKNNTKWW